MNQLVAQVREFNRDWSRLIGALDYAHRLGTPHSLPEARVLYELARRDVTAVLRLRQELEMDAGQLSRLLARTEAAGLVRREADPEDSRRQLARLTERGRSAAALLDDRAAEATGALLAPLTPPERERLAAALRTLARLLGRGERNERSEPARSFHLRPPAPGELGWVVQRHGALYTAAYGWNASFEALVAEVVAQYAGAHDPAREAVWIAEHDGAPVGSVFCVADPDDPRTARLRLLLVEPHARGLGIGRALVAACVRFAREAGYGRVVLWTNDVLSSARRIYQAAGFTLTDSEPHTRFGPRETGQHWELPLA